MSWWRKIRLWSIRHSEPDLGPAVLLAVIVFLVITALLLRGS